MVDGLLGVLRSVFEFSNLLEQQRTGAITRKLAGWAAILAAPTMLAAIYGMNFWNLPFLTYKYGYIYIVTAMAVFGSSLFWRFRRLKWL
jgi:magnesium transporter